MSYTKRNVFMILSHEFWTQVSVFEQTFRETTTHVYNSQMHDMNRSRTSGEGSAEKRKPRKRKAEASGSDNIFPGTYT